MFTLIFALFFQAHAEPWLSSRYSTNCAACHAPGRVNVVAKERRCTLSCQGCHTNPNGGGLRNFYGKWNQERWLRSSYIQSYRLNKPRPDVTSEQQYAEPKLKEFLGRNDAKLNRRAIDDGFRLKETSRMLPESAYDRRSTDEETIEPNLEYAHLRMPENDPYRLRRTRPFNAGLDWRYAYLDQTKANVKTKAVFPMEADLGVSAEPFDGVSFVFESRFLNGPTREGWDEGFTTQSVVKSAYAMVDDLAYNSFVMAGIFRPMFGHYNPDHTSLFAFATGLDQKSAYKAITLGTAPNVPFFNFHYIMPMGDTSSTVPEPRSQDQGFAANAGLRFVTLGLFITGSYWKTTADYRKTLSKIYENTMMSLTGGGTLWRWTLVWDVTRVARDEKSVRNDAATVITVENRFRILGENYLLANYETLGSDLSLRDGSATQMSVGWSSFPMSSVELSAIYKQLKLTSAGVGSDTKVAMAQLHLFF